jgi:hypothetical protein|tara:strand:- start:16278 stop:16580 length:303 start_codon:yes stop_codon:yes gene_type:complete
MNLDSHKNIKVEHRIEAEKKQEFKLIGSQRKRRGQKLFALDRDNLKVYEVEIQRKEVAELNKKLKTTHKAVINPKHPMLWAINRKNAIRKFNNYEGLNLK